MVFVKVRETYDLHTIKNKMSVIAIHTPKPQIIKNNFPGLLLQCKSYRPYSCDVRLACASVLPLDPQSVGTSSGDVAPEDMFNPILYSAMSNFGMSQLEARINYLAASPSLGGSDLEGNTAIVDVDSLTDQSDEFATYYGLLSNAHGWKHAAPQSGLSMSNLKPLVYELLYNVGDTMGNSNESPSGGTPAGGPTPEGAATGYTGSAIRGNGKPLPMINCTSYSTYHGENPFKPQLVENPPQLPWTHEIDVPWINCVVGAIIVPPSRLHELFYRMVVEWTLEFSSIRPIGEVTSWNGLAMIGNQTHYQNYSYSSTKEALTGSSDTILSSDVNMVSANVDVNKVM